MRTEEEIIREIISLEKEISETQRKIDSINTLSDKRDSQIYLTNLNTLHEKRTLLMWVLNK